MMLHIGDTMPRIETRETSARGSQVLADSSRAPGAALVKAIAALIRDRGSGFASAGSSIASLIRERALDGAGPL
jgi:hypothetical protein